MPGPFELLKVDLSIDGTQAFLDLRAPDVAAEDLDAPLDEAGLKAILSAEHGLSFILDDVVSDVVARANTGEALEAIIIADSKTPMVPGVDGSLEWLVEQDESIDSDSLARVDFYSYSALKNVYEGQELAKLHPAQEGQSGKNVKNEAIEAPAPKPLDMSAGENVSFDQSTGIFSATIGGRVEQRGNTIVVSRSYAVPGNVDFASGNVNFDGHVRVTGNVVDNFKVEATEGVQVDGIVEAAFITAKGSVTVIGGVNMREKGEIVAQDDVITKFINNSNVRCGGILKVEKEIVNSKVIVGSVDSPEAEIAGGRIVASGNILVKEAGSEMGVTTVLQAGYNQDIVDEIEELEKDIKERETRDGDLKTKLKAAKKVEHKLSADKKAGLTKLFDRSKMMVEETKLMQNKLIELRKKIYDKTASVTISKAVHPGVVIKIGRYDKMINDDFDGFRRFVWNEDKGEVEAVFE